MKKDGIQTRNRKMSTKSRKKKPSPNLLTCIKKNSVSSGGLGGPQGVLNLGGIGLFDGPHHHHFNTMRQQLLHSPSQSDHHHTHHHQATPSHHLPHHLHGDNSGVGSSSGGNGGSHRSAFSNIGHQASSLIHSHSNNPFLGDSFYDSSSTPIAQHHRAEGLSINGNR